MGRGESARWRELDRAERGARGGRVDDCDLERGRLAGRRVLRRDRDLERRLYHGGRRGRRRRRRRCRCRAGGRAGRREHDRRRHDRRSDRHGQTDRSGSCNSHTSPSLSHSPPAARRRSQRRIYSLIDRSGRKFGVVAVWGLCTAGGEGAWRRRGRGGRRAGAARWRVLAVHRGLPERARLPTLSASADSRSRPNTAAPRHIRGDPGAGSVRAERPSAGHQCPVLSLVVALRGESRASRSADLPPSRPFPRSRRLGNRSRPPDAPELRASEQGP